MIFFDHLSYVLNTQNSLVMHGQQVETPWLLCQHYFKWEVVVHFTYLLARAWFSQESSSRYLLGNCTLVHTQKYLVWCFICKLTGLDLENLKTPKCHLYSPDCIFAAKQINELSVLSHHPCLIHCSVTWELWDQADTLLHLVQIISI